MTDPRHNIRRRWALAAVSVAVVLYGIVGFPTPDNPEPSQAAAHSQSGVVCRTVTFMGASIEKCAYVAHIPHNHDYSKPNKPVVTRTPNNPDNPGNPGNNGNGNDNNDNNRCGVNSNPDGHGGCTKPLYGRPSRCEAAGLAYDSVSQLCINKSGTREDPDDTRDDRNYCPDRRQWRSPDSGGECVVKTRSDDPDRSKHCPAGQAFYSTLGCSYPCDGGQILVGGSCRTVTRSAPRSQTPNRPVSCPVGYSGTPPNCVEGTPEVYVLDGSVGENAGTVDVIVALSHRATTASTVDFATSDASAKAGSDYTTVSRKVTIPASKQTATVPVPIIDDTDDEAYRETFTVTLSNAAGGAKMGTSPSGSVAILDDDYPPTVSVTGSRARERDGILTFTVSLDRAVSNDVTVTAATADGTATAGADYRAVAGREVTIVAGRTQASVAVSLINDTDVEAAETFTLTVSDPVNAKVGASGTATGTILDDDPSGFSGVCHVTDPITGFYRLSVVGLDRSGWTKHSRHVSFGGRWTDPDGNLVTSGTSSIVAGVTYTFTSVEWYWTSGYFGRINVYRARGGTTTAVCKAGLVAPPPWQVSVSDWTADEGDGFALATVSLNRLGPSNAATVKVTLNTSDATATAGSDYTAVTAQTVAIPKNHLQSTVVIPITDDDVREPTETFKVTISNPVGDTTCNFALGAGGCTTTPAPALGTATATVTITDDDLPAVQLTGPVSAEEGNGLDFTVALGQAAAADVTVTVSTAADPGAEHPATATGTRRDYRPLSGHQVTIPAGELTATVTVSSVDDSIDEFDETMLLRIDSATSSGGVEVGDANEARGTITDNDNAPTVSISAASGPESGPLTFDVSLSAVSGKPVSVRASASDASPVSAAGVATCAATDGTEDYQDTASTVSFSPGSKSETFAVAVCGDTAVETSETFNVSLSAAADASVSASAGSAVGTILDDDSLEMSGLTVECAAAGAAPQLTVRWEPPASAAIVSRYEAQIYTGTAVADTQWFAFLGGRRVAWNTNVGSWKRAATFPPRWANNYNNRPPLSYGETYTVRMRPVAASTGPWSDATVTCPTLPVVSLSPAALTVAEDAGTATFTVSLDKTWSAAVTVTAATADGTAVAGSDYTAVNQSVSIAAGSRSATFDVAVTDDSDDESDETFTVGLSGPSGAVPGTETSATVTITDNDEAEQQQQVVCSAGWIYEPGHPDANEFGCRPGFLS